jgi:hypothetical protein
MLTGPRPTRGAIDALAKARGVSRQTIYNSMKAGRLVVLPSGALGTPDDAQPLGFVMRPGAVERFCLATGIERHIVQAGLLAMPPRFGVAADGELFPWPEKGPVSPEKNS